MEEATGTHSLVEVEEIVVDTEGTDWGTEHILVGYVRSETTRKQGSMNGQTDGNGCCWGGGNPWPYIGIGGPGGG